MKGKIYKKNTSSNQIYNSLEENKKLAIILMLLSSLSFAFMQLFVKFLYNIPVMERVFFRNLVSLFFALILIKKNGFRLFGKLENQKYLFLRSIPGFLGVVIYFYSTDLMPIADATALMRLSPFFVTLLAGYFLNEKLSKTQIPTLFIAFIGALFIIKPEFNYDLIPSLIMLIAAFFAGIAYTTIRFMKDFENPLTIVFHFSLISVIGSLPFMALNFVQPTINELFMLLGIGITASLGQFFLTYSYKNAPAAEISILNYTHILFSGILGFVFLSEVPDLISMLGMILIVVAAYFMLNNN